MMRMVFGIIVLAVTVTGARAQGTIPVNFNHLRSLTETIGFLGDTVDIVHIYSLYPDYRWQDAKESGNEGIACVDDAARAAVIYLTHYQQSGRRESLERAKRLIRFVMKMQTDDGQWYNFIFHDGTINKDGPTSRKSFAWWAARGIWALGKVYRALFHQEPAFARTAGECIERSLPQIDSLLTRYGQYDTASGFQVPRWLISGSGADATSELLLGLTEYWAATHSRRVQRMIGQLADGLMAMQDRRDTAETFGMFRSWQTLWHAWGNSQTQALATAGKILNENRMTAAAEREARYWYSRILAHGFVKEIDLAKANSSKSSNQISYDIRPMVVGALRLYEATGRRDYLPLAGLLSSWYFGNNPARQNMYDPLTGRCFDGVDSAGKVNLNSGAESTIEALAVMLELNRYRWSNLYTNVRLVEMGRDDGQLYGLYRMKAGTKLLVVHRNTSPGFLITEGSAVNDALRKLKRSAIH